MSTLKFLDANGVLQEYDVDGTGSNADPMRAQSPAILTAIQTRMGAIGDTANPAGSALAILRKIAESYTEGSAAGVSIGTAFTTLAIIDVRGKKTLGFRIDNTGATALNDFQIQYQFRNGFTNWDGLTFVDADFTTGTGRQGGNAVIQLMTSDVSVGTVRALGAAANARLRMRTDGYATIRLQAKVATGSTTMEIEWIAES